MNATLMEREIDLERPGQNVREPRETPESKADVPGPREVDWRQHIAKLLEQRVAPQHWGINE